MLLISSKLTFSSVSRLNAGFLGANSHFPANLCSISNISTSSTVVSSGLENVRLLQACCIDTPRICKWVFYPRDMQLECF